MSTTNLTDGEAALLRAVLSRIVVRDRTGEVGILHGADRFVSTHLSLKRSDRETLDAAVKKIGLAEVIVLKQ